MLLLIFIFNQFMISLVETPNSLAISGLWEHSSHNPDIARRIWSLKLEYSLLFLEYIINYQLKTYYQLKCSMI